MLVITRRVGEKILIGEDISLLVLHRDYTQALASSKNPKDALWRPPESVQHGHRLAGSGVRRARALGSAHEGTDGGALERFGDGCFEGLAGVLAMSAAHGNRPAGGVAAHCERSHAHRSTRKKPDSKTEEGQIGTNKERSKIKGFVHRSCKSLIR